MRRASPERGENSGPGKEVYRELDSRPGIREQPGPGTDLEITIPSQEITFETRLTNGFADPSSKIKFNRYAGP